MEEKILRQTRELIDLSGDSYKFSKTMSAIEAAYTENESGLVIGQCKSLIEGFCKTILDKNGVEYESDISIGKLAKKAVTSLEIGSGEENEQKTREAFIKIINSFSHNLENAASAIGSLRNDYCPLAHGRSVNHQPLHMLYAKFVASQTDAVVAFLVNLLNHHELLEPEIVFRENEEFNDYLSEEYGEIKIYGDSYQAPEILFNLKPSQYKIALKEYQDGKES